MNRTVNYQLYFCTLIFYSMYLLNVISYYTRCSPTDSASSGTSPKNFLPENYIENIQENCIYFSYMRLKLKNMFIFYIDNE